MKLRTQALLAAIVLVAVVCGALIFFVSRLYETSERRRIAILLDDLATQQLQALDDYRERTAEALGRLFVDQAFQTLLRDSAVAIKDNFLAKAEDCLKQLPQADLALIAYDNLLAEERRAEVLHRGEDLSLCAAATRRDADGQPRCDAAALAALYRAPAFWRLLAEVYAQQPAGELGYTAYVPTSTALFLVVATPFAESLQEAEAPVGVGVAALAITDDYLAARRELKLMVHARYFADDAVGAPPDLVIHAGGRVAAATSARSAAETLMRAAQDSPERVSLELPLALEDRVEVRLRGSAAGAGSSGACDRRTPNAEGVRTERHIALPLSIHDATADTPGVGLITFKSLDAELVGLRRLQHDAALAGAALAVLGALAAYGLAVLVIRRLGRLESAARQVQGGDFQVQVDVGGRDEITRLGTAFNDMVGGLKALGLYTDPTIARRVVQATGGGLYSARHEGTIFFSDIKDFTSISETMRAEVLTSLLNEYFTAMGRCIAEEGGYLDKFIGDAVMAFWGPPFLTDGSHALRAARAALRCQEEAAALRAAWESRGRLVLHQRIGLATGEVVVGDLGSETKRNFTVIGDAVNLASRLEGANKQHGTQILIDEATRQRADAALRTRGIGSIQVKGKARPVEVHELLGLAD